MFMALILLLRAWLGWVASQADRRKQALAAIERAGGRVYDDWQHTGGTISGAELQVDAGLLGLKSKDERRDSGSETWRVRSTRMKHGSRRKGILSGDSWNGVKCFPKALFLCEP
jgi:hypothetical protein